MAFSFYVEFQVRFIDYGNCDSCHIDELRKANMFGDIPVLSRRYKLANIQPPRNNEIWPENARQFCSNKILEKHCEIVLSAEQLNEPLNGDEAVELCQLNIFTRDEDLASALIDYGYAERLILKIH